MCLWKAWQCLLSPSGSPRSWGRTGQGPGHPHSSPEHSLRLMCVDPCRPVVGRRWERPPLGAEGGQAPTGRCLVVVGCRSSRWSRSWLGAATAITEERLVVGRPGRGPAPFPGTLGPAAEPSPGPRCGVSAGGVGRPHPVGHAGAPGVWGCGARWAPNPCPCACSTWSTASW